jgi:hypothetical protein
MEAECLAPKDLIQPTISLEMPVPSQGHCGFPSFPVVDWFCLFVDLWVLPFPLEDCPVFGNLVFSLIYVICVFVQNTLCCVFALFVVVLCAQCCQFLCNFHFWLPLRNSLTFIRYILLSSFLLGCIPQSLVFCVVFCKSFFVFLSFLFRPWYCLSFLEFNWITNLTPALCAYLKTIPVFALLLPFCEEWFEVICFFRFIDATV